MYYLVFIHFHPIRYHVMSPYLSCSVLFYRHFCASTPFISNSFTFSSSLPSVHFLSFSIPLFSSLLFTIISSLISCAYRVFTTEGVATATMATAGVCFTAVTVTLSKGKAGGLIPAAGLPLAWNNRSIRIVSCTVTPI